MRLNRLAAEVGVSASAAYRHFPDGLGELLVAVGDVGRAELTARIRRALSRAGGDDVEDAARRRFRASGAAYVAYVTDQPGLFQVASRHSGARRPDADPHALLEQCLDDLVAVGALPVERRPYASVAAWAAVHGVAVLLAEGALRRVGPAERAGWSSGRSTWSPPASDGAYSWPVCDSPVAGSTVCAATPGCSGLSSGTASSRAWSAETEGSSAGPLGTGSVMAAPGGSRV